jgi:hypothetical protein
MNIPVEDRLGKRYALVGIDFSNPPRTIYVLQRDGMTFGVTEERFNSGYRQLPTNAYAYSAIACMLLPFLDTRLAGVAAVIAVLAVLGHFKNRRDCAWPIEEVKDHE